jgi:hypothetical protein
MKAIKNNNAVHNSPLYSFLLFYLKVQISFFVFMHNLVHRTLLQNGNAINRNKSYDDQL